MQRPKAFLKKQFPVLHTAFADLPFLGWYRVMHARVLDLSYCIGFNSRSHTESDMTARTPSIFVDISSIAERDMATGIQRVARGYLRGLGAIPGLETRVLPVCSPGNASGFVIADGTDCLITFRRGDLLLLADLAPQALLKNRSYLRRLINEGVKVYVVLYDLLPLNYPEYFSVSYDIQFRAWLHAALELSGVIAISQTVAAQLGSYILSKGMKYDRLDVIVNYCGIELGDSPIKNSCSTDQHPWFSHHHQILMVGTVEPRKGYQEALEAIEILWKKDKTVALTIVGKEGWKVRALAKRLDALEQRGHPIRWLQNASDNLLTSLYRQSGFLLANSKDEGFGLPLIEAEHAGLPVLASDIPIFREVLGPKGNFFDGSSPEKLANAIDHFCCKQKTKPNATQHRFPDWQGSAISLLEKIKWNPANDTFRSARDISEI